VCCVTVVYDAPLSTKYTRDWGRQRSDCDDSPLSFKHVHDHMWHIQRASYEVRETDDRDSDSDDTNGEKSISKRKQAFIHEKDW